MKSKWEPCPFCGKELRIKPGPGATRIYPNGKTAELREHPQVKSCPLGFGFITAKKEWNKRVLKQKEIVQMRFNILKLKVPPRKNIDDYEEGCIDSRNEAIESVLKVLK